MAADTASAYTRQLYTSFGAGFSEKSPRANGFGMLYDGVGTSARRLVAICSGRNAILYCKTEAVRVNTVVRFH
jgi:hypothetical protein